MPNPIEALVRKAVTAGISRIAVRNRERMGAGERPNPYLTGVHAPMDRELTLTDLRVSGSIPPALDGRYLRIGPNPLRPPVSAAAHHWFVGDGMVHGIRLCGGRALWYRNRWIRSSAVSRVLGEPEVPGPRHGRDNVNTNVLAHAGRTWALVESGPYPVELGAELQTVAHNPFDGTLRGGFSAHPHRDPSSGELHAICYEATDPGMLRHVVVDAAGRVIREEPVAVSHGPSVHDCMITASSVVVLDLPVTFSLPALVAGYTFPYAWNPAHDARVGLLGRQAPGDSVVWCQVEPCYVFHPCNAWDLSDGRVVMDVVAHATMFEHDRQGPVSATAHFERWTIDPASRRVTREVIDDSPQEFPRPDERFVGQPYRHAWAASLQRAGGGFAGGPCLIHHDLQAGTRRVHDFGPGCHVGEFVFEPRHPGADEGDGWLMGLVTDAAAGTTDFVILDALDMSARPQAVVHLPHQVPAGFHGNWVRA